MQRAFTNILCKNVNEVAQFYETVLSMKRHEDFGWFIILTHSDMPKMEFGLLDRTHETVPSEIVADPAGMILTFVVDDVEQCFARAEKK